MRINMDMADEVNESRKRLKVTWKTVILAGLNALQGPTKPKAPVLDPSLGQSLKEIARQLPIAWKAYKDYQEQQP